MLGEFHGIAAMGTLVHPRNDALHNDPSAYLQLGDASECRGVGQAAGGRRCSYAHVVGGSLLYSSNLPATVRECPSVVRPIPTSSDCKNRTRSDTLRCDHL